MVNRHRSPSPDQDLKAAGLVDSPVVRFWCGRFRESPLIVPGPAIFTTSSRFPSGFLRGVLGLRHRPRPNPRLIFEMRFLPFYPHGFEPYANVCSPDTPHAAALYPFIPPPFTFLKTTALRFEFVLCFGASSRSSFGRSRFFPVLSALFCRHTFP